MGRKEATFEPTYDGPPRFEPIAGTSLAAATNTPSAVIQVGPTSYYGCENGVWFEASAPTGPWAVAATVPEVIYTIPPSSRLYYVTFVRVYDSTPDVVYVGYTPGYYGTVVSSSTSTVVYGTGWYYPPYVGSYWYGDFVFSTKGWGRDIRFVSKRAGSRPATRRSSAVGGMGS